MAAVADAGGEGSIGIVCYCVDSLVSCCFFFFFSSRRRHTRCLSDWSSDVCSSDLLAAQRRGGEVEGVVARQPAAGGQRAQLATDLGGGEVGVPDGPGVHRAAFDGRKIGRASCRERG